MCETKTCYYVYDTPKCQAYVQKITYFFFWERWYWNAKFYCHEEYLPCDGFDGFEDSESDALEAIHAKYDEQIGKDHND